jgi:hypothetical protein
MRTAILASNISACDFPDIGSSGFFQTLSRDGRSGRIAMQSPVDLLDDFSNCLECPETKDG